MNWWKTAQLNVMPKQADLSDLASWLRHRTSISIPALILTALLAMNGVSSFIGEMETASSQQERDQVVVNMKQEVSTALNNNPNLLTEAQEMAYPSVPVDGVNIEEWVDRIIHQESLGDPNAVSPKGAVGIMQIMPKTWEEMTKEVYGKPLPLRDRNDPEKNKKVGIAYLNKIKKILRQNLKQEPTIEQILAAYNGGPYRLIKNKGNVWAMPEESKNYVEKITGTRKPT